MDNKHKIIIAVLVIMILCLLIFIISAEIAAAPEKKIEPALLKNDPEMQLPANTLPEAPELAKTTTLIFGGDVMLSRVVGQKMEKYDDWSWPLKNIASELSSADLTIINLESPMTVAKNHLVKTGSFSFNADPRSVAGLVSAGVDIATLANNHMTNQGAKGISDTRKILFENGISGIGAGSNESQAHEPAIREINGLKFGFLSYAYPDDDSVADANKPGIANMDIIRMNEDISRLKQQVDLVIIIMHAGTEYVSKPNRQQTEFAHSAIDAGADLVVGHHPHWTQTTEIYSPSGINFSQEKITAESGIPPGKGKPIIYSLGNLVFDQMWSEETQEGALAKIIVSDKKITSIEIIPITIKDYGQAEIATSTLIRQKILDQIRLKNSLIEL